MTQIFNNFVFDLANNILRNVKVLNLVVLLIFITYRLFGVYCIQSSFVPDEYWQSLEVAHNLTFGYGHITWEWSRQIRSCTYPLLISFIYRLLPDSKFVLIQVPRICQALITACGDFCAYKLSCQLFGKRVGRWMIFNLLTSWFLFYCAPRTLTNTVEAMLTVFGLYLYPWDNCLCSRCGRDVKLNYLWFAGFSVIMRPTGIIIWIPLYLRHIWNRKEVLVKIVVKTIFIGMAILSILVLVDRWCYNQWVLTPYQFFIFNWSNDIGAFYGSQKWFWYFTDGFPVVMSVHVIPFFMGICMLQLRNLYFIVFWVIIVLSQLSHKEFRFLLPVLHISLIVCSYVLNHIHTSRVKFFDYKVNKNVSLFLAFMVLLVNIPISIYVGFFHQRGVLDATLKLSDMVTKDSSVLFLMPCHSTPYYSYIHQNISMRFLTCEPNLNMKENYLDEADMFYSNPSDWLNSQYGTSSYNEVGSVQNNIKNLPTHVLIFDVLYSHISEFIRGNNYALCYSAFHTHFHDGRVGTNVHIYCRK